MVDHGDYENYRRGVHYRRHRRYLKDDEARIVFCRNGYGDHRHIDVFGGRIAKYVKRVLNDRQRNGRGKRAFENIA